MNSLLIDSLAEVVAEKLSGVSDGHCARIDEMHENDARELVSSLRRQYPELSTFVLSGDNDDNLHVTIDKSVELRNLKSSIFVLVIPFGIGEGAGSLENSFQRFRLDELLGIAAEKMQDLLTDLVLKDALFRLRREMKTVDSESWAHFVSTTVEAADLQIMAESIWMLGLVPDSWDVDFLNKIKLNKQCARAIAQPRNPTSSLESRLESAGLVDLDFRQKLIAFLEKPHVSISNPKIWCELIAKSEDGALNFSNWKVGGLVKSPLKSVSMVSFRKSDGTIRPSTKLETDQGTGQPFVSISNGKPGQVVVEWKTNPSETDAVDKWTLDLLPPKDLRDGEEAPSRRNSVDGSKRKATFKFSFEEEDLASASRFIIRLTPRDESGSSMLLSDGTEAIIETEEFDVHWVEGVVERNPRQPNTYNVYLARLQAHIEQSEVVDEKIEIDYDGSVVTHKSMNGSKRLVRFSQIVFDAQLEAVRLRKIGIRHFFDQTQHFDISLSGRELQTVAIPEPLRVARERFLEQLSADSIRMIEAISWNDQLSELLDVYIAEYQKQLGLLEKSETQELLSLDTIEILVQSGSKKVRASVITPLHPLRLAWLREYARLTSSWCAELCEENNGDVRKSSIDVGLVASISPRNLPFLHVASDGSQLLYMEELVFGCGLYLPVEHSNQESLSQQVCAALGLDRKSHSIRERSRSIAKRVSSYRDSHPIKASYGVLAVNAGTGESMVDPVRALLGFSPSEFDLPEIESRVFLTVYADEVSFNSPLEGLQELQREIEQSHSLPSNFLAGPISLRSASLSQMAQDEESVHISIIQDTATLSVGGSEQIEPRRSLLNGLLTALVTRYSDQKYFSSAPTFGSGDDQTIQAMHQAHQIAASSVSTERGVATLRTDLTADSIENLRLIHEKSDWVITLDRFLGPDVYEIGDNFGIGGSYILDYSPDFVEGFGDKITVTTKHKSELTTILSAAMDDLGLASAGSESTVIEDLNNISGRLVLKLIGNLTQAREAVGLAAVLAYLRRTGKLENKIIIPVDSHAEIFGVSNRGGDEGTRRCDLLSVELVENGIVLEFIEVKTRQTVSQVNGIIDHVRDQLVQSRATLLNRIDIDRNHLRIDRDLQRAHFFSLLHYYADRSERAGFFTPDSITDVHKKIDDLVDKSSIETILTAYVVCPEEPLTRNVDNADASIVILGERELGMSGFTTRHEIVQRTVLVNEDGGITDDAPAESVSKIEAVESGSIPEVIDSQVPISSNESTDIPVLEVQHAIRDSPDKVCVILGEEKSGRKAIWEISTTGSPHALITGIPGQGKSVTTRRIVEECSSQGLPSLIFDFHGDMRDALEGAAQIIDISKGLPINPFGNHGTSKAEINGNAIELAEIIAFVCDLGDIQQNHVYEAIKLTYQECGWTVDGTAGRTPEMADFVAVLEKVETAKRGKNALARLTPLTDFGLFEGLEGDVNFLARTTVIDMSKLKQEAVQKAATSFVLRKIYKEMTDSGPVSRMQQMIVLDEAHRSAKDATLPKLMKEGRKFGIGVVVASQQISDFHPNLLGNVGLKIAFRTNFPESRKVAGMFVDRTGLDVSALVESLGVGEALVSIPPKGNPLKLKMLR